ncbi:LamG domain-containing protein [Flavobacterium sp. 3HN19-14]|uniref:LamG domain-containing protein n=1 Tax=Flavobacterium sp. 3HN19-14 TaxID=3448133 RepID=UPI003EDED030
MKKIYSLLLIFCCISVNYAQINGGALDFDGNDDYVSIAQSSGSTISGNFTIEAWIQPKHATKTMHIFSSRTPSENGFDLQILNGNTIHGDIGNGTAWLTTTANATYNYTVGTWFHVAYVVTTTGYTIYVNGNQLATGTYAGGAATPLLLNNTHNLQLGRNLVKILITAVRWTM